MDTQVQKSRTQKLAWCYHRPVWRERCWLFLGRAICRHSLNVLSKKKILFVCVQSAKNLREMVGNNEIKIFAITTAWYPLHKMFKSTLWWQSMYCDIRENLSAGDVELKQQLWWSHLRKTRSILYESLFISGAVLVVFVFALSSHNKRIFC